MTLLTLLTLAALIALTAFLGQCMLMAYDLRRWERERHRIQEREPKK